MTQNRPRIGGVVLCGGESQRMGRPKAWLRFGDDYLLQRVMRVVATVVSPVVVATRRGVELPALPPEVGFAYDAVNAAGPLAGMAAGFDALRGRCDAVFVTACDHALLTAPFIRRLIELLRNAPGVVPESAGRIVPTVAVYRLTTRVLLAELLAAGELRATEFAVRCTARRATAADFADVDPNLDALRNINTPEDYREARRTATAGPGGPTTRADATDPSGPEA